MRGVAIGLCCLVLGCGTTEPGTDAGAPDAGPRDAWAPDVGHDAGPPILEPSLFDCTSAEVTSGTRVPRASTIPIACALDPTCRTPQVSGHRGAGGQLGRIAPEDTLAAYRAGIALGIEYLETDPRPTADDVIVNMHDTTVDRTTDGTGSVDAMTFDQVRALHIRTTLPGDYGCERVPTLREILETARGRAVVLVDANKTDRVDLLVQAIHDADALEWAIFDTSSLDKIDRALALEPGLHFMIRPAAAEITAQLDHFAPRLPVIVELDLADAMLGAPMVHARGTRVLSDTFEADVLADVTGDGSAYGTALDMGLDIIQCDRPDLALAMLRMRGLR